MIDPAPLWDFDDPAGSEARFRAAVDTADGTDRLVLLTQLARAAGLQDRFDEGHAILDDLGVADPEVATRVSLERGRLFASAGEKDEARPHFEAAAASAEGAGLDALRVDALHMLAIIAPAEEQLDRNYAALDIARRSESDAARNWDASLLNNIGMTLADAERWAEALPVFEEALAARERIGQDSRTRVAKWMVGWAQRNLGRREDALATMTALKAELEAVGEEDPYVDEELALLQG